MRKICGMALAAALVALTAACSGPVNLMEPGAAAGVTVDQARLDADFASVLESLGTEGAAAAMAEFDAAYGTTLSADFAGQLARPKLGGDSDYPPLTGMPFSKDGAVYLSGGGTDLVGTVIGWVAPKSLPGGYFHGATLDLEKFDPTNLDAPALETAVSKGAGYESANDWMRKVNACVMNPAFTVDEARLDAAQAAVAYYCNLESGQAYGFFKNYVNIFNVVTKEDRYWWYCTKVVWEAYKNYGIDLDSNDLRVDFTKSGLYSLVKSYYTALYFWSPSRAAAAIAAYIADTRGKIVMAEEIMLSPYLTKVFEAIRN